MNRTSKPQYATLQGITNRLDGRYIRRGGTWRCLQKMEIASAYFAPLELIQLESNIADM